MLVTRLLNETRGGDLLWGFQAVCGGKAEERGWIVGAEGGGEGTVCTVKRAMWAVHGAAGKVQAAL